MLTGQLYKNGWEIRFDLRPVVQRHLSNEPLLSHHHTLLFWLPSPYLVQSKLHAWNPDFSFFSPCPFAFPVRTHNATIHFPCRNCTFHSLPLPLRATRNTSTSQMGSPYSLLFSCFSEVCAMTMRAVRKTLIMSKDTWVLSWDKEGDINLAKERSKQSPETLSIWLHWIWWVMWMRRWVGYLQGNKEDLSPDFPSGRRQGRWHCLYRPRWWELEQIVMWE